MTSILTEGTNRPLKSPTLSMLSRLLLAQWPVGEERELYNWIQVTLPNGERGANYMSSHFLYAAVQLGYLEVHVDKTTYQMLHTRTTKVCKLPKAAQKRDGKFPVSQDVHACLVWGHPVWERLKWAAMMNPDSPEIRYLQATLRPFGWLGAKFGKLRWALGKYLLEGTSLGQSVVLDFGTNVLVMCGMLRLGVDAQGRLALLSAAASQQLLMDTLSRENVLRRILVEPEVSND